MRRKSYRFDRTYEELKLFVVVGFFVRSYNRFDRTYEELKPKQLREKVLDVLRFDRTYEELKHGRPLQGW